MPLGTCGGGRGIRTPGPFGLRFSRPPQSTTLPSLRENAISIASADAQYKPAKGAAHIHRRLAAHIHRRLAGVVTPACAATSRPRDLGDTERPPTPSPPTWQL